MMQGVVELTPIRLWPREFRFLVRGTGSGTIGFGCPCSCSVWRRTLGHREQTTCLLRNWRRALAVAYRHYRLSGVVVHFNGHPDIFRTFMRFNLNSVRA